MAQEIEKKFLVKGDFKAEALEAGHHPVAAFSMGFAAWHAGSEGALLANVCQGRIGHEAHLHSGGSRGVGSA